MRESRQATAWRFTGLFLLLCAVVGVIIASLYYAQTGTERALLKTRERSGVTLQSEMIVSDFRSLVSDLLVLAESQSLHRLLDGGGAGERRALAREYLVFAFTKGVYDQIRYLDATGFEVIRINWGDGKGMIVPQHKLQSKSSRYYFTEAFGLNHREVFISLFDLNIEKGVIEQPLKPTIRFCTPVFDGKGQNRGVMVLNFLGAKLIGKFKKLAEDATGQHMLLNSSGYWLHGPRAEDEWGFMYPDRQDRTFGNAFPAAWQIVSQTESGQFLNDDGLFTFATVYPIPQLEPSEVGATAQADPDSPPSRVRQTARDGRHHWKIVSHISPDVLADRSRQLLGRLAQAYAVLVVVLAIVSWFLTRFRAERELANRALRESERLAAIGQTMAALAHESRNALQRSQACLEMLAKRVKDRSEALDLIERVQRAQHDLFRLYEEVQSYAAPIRLRLQQYDLRRILQETWSHLIPHHNQVNATIREHGTDVDTTCFVDPFAIRQALRNILENALSDENSPETQHELVEIDVTWSSDKLHGQAALAISIRDNGPGLSPEQAKQIFDPFYTTKSKGTGLGMAITQRIIESHKGEIAVGPYSDRGVEIVLILPREQS